ncbi:hypothetical protein [Promicromonospora sp. NPDC023805]|uniref:hypothetical protein n=1 Tax=Promicromonospora sp. NPDC023805 TaxID=3154696 RepID=UPI003403E859
MTVETGRSEDIVNEVPALPRGTTLLHIGAPKTGTTSLQQSAAGSRARLREGGVMYPGRHENHRRFARSLLGYRKEPGLAELAPAHWSTGILKQLVNNERDYALVSSEAFSTAGARDVARVRAAFTMPTHVVLTLRPLPGMLLSTWQQCVKSGEFKPFDAWLNHAFRDLPMLHMPGADVFDESDGTNLVGRWADAFGPENMTVVVLDPTDRDHIFRVFEDLLGQRRGALERVTANSGMSAVETEFFRQAAERIFQETGSRARRGLFHGGAVNTVISVRPRQTDEPSLRVPERVIRHTATAAIRIAEQIESAGVRVVGDLSDLAAAGRVGDQAPLPDEVPSDLALIAAGGLARRAVQLRGTGSDGATTADVYRPDESDGIPAGRLSAAEVELLDALAEHLTGDGNLDEADVRQLRASAARRIVGARTEGADAGLATVPHPGTAPAGRPERIPSELALQAVIGVYEGAQRLS